MEWNQLKNFINEIKEIKQFQNILKNNILEKIIFFLNNVNIFFLNDHDDCIDKKVKIYII